MKMLILMAASLFVAYMAVTTEELKQQYWFAAGIVLMLIFGGI